MQQPARKKQTRTTALKSDRRTLARQANLTEFINSPLHNPEFSALNGRANCAVHTFSGTQVQFGGLIFHQRRSFGRRQQYLDALWPLPLIPRLTLLESEKSLSASLIPFREHTKLATVLPPRETRTAVMSLIPKYPRIIVRGRCVDNSVRYDRIRANLTRCRWVPSEIASKKGKLFCAALGMEKWKSLLCVYAHKPRKSSSAALFFAWYRKARCKAVSVETFVVHISGPPEVALLLAWLASFLVIHINDVTLRSCLRVFSIPEQA
jgi:hypothetical protein